MTDEQIIKALECCGNIVDSTCKGCAYHETYNASCVVRLMRDAFDLINRQKAEIVSITEEYNDMLEQRNKVEEFTEEQQKEISELTYKLMGVMHSVDKWLDGDELKQDEVNRAATMREKTLRIVEQKQAEIERLKKENEFHRKTITDNAQRALEVTIEEVEKAKSEAIKEFAERLKERADTHDCTYYMSKYKITAVSIDAIDNLVKEMVGEKE